MIIELLKTGKENATPGKELAEALHTNLRTVAAIVEKERREGSPILATYRGNKPGYFIAEYKEEAEDYTALLKHRAVALFTTRQAVIKSTAELPNRPPEQ